MPDIYETLRISEQHEDEHKKIAEKRRNNPCREYVRFKRDMELLFDWDKKGRPQNEQG